MSENLAQVGLRIDPIEFGADDQRVHRREALATTIRAHDQEILATKVSRPSLIESFKFNLVAI